jgi:hypothetical protein
MYSKASKPGMNLFVQQMKDNSEPRSVPERERSKMQELERLFEKFLKTHSAIMACLLSHKAPRFPKEMCRNDQWGPDFRKKSGAFLGLTRPAYPN